MNAQASLLFIVLIVVLSLGGATGAVIDLFRADLAPHAGMATPLQQAYLLRSIARTLMTLLLLAFGITLLLFLR